MDALSKGVDGVLIAGCHPGSAITLMETLRLGVVWKCVMMEDMGIETDRLRGRRMGFQRQGKL